MSKKLIVGDTVEFEGIFYRCAEVAGKDSCKGCHFNDNAYSCRFSSHLGNTNLCMGLIFIKKESKEVERKCDFSGYKVGDKVFIALLGWREITETGITGRLFKASDIWFNCDGSLSNCEHTIVVAFHNEFTIPPEAFKKPLPKYKKGQILEVSNDDYAWYLRRFSHYETDSPTKYNIRCYDSHNVPAKIWDYHRIPKDI